MHDLQILLELWIRVIFDVLNKCDLKRHNESIEYGQNDYKNIPFGLDRVFVGDNVLWILPSNDLVDEPIYEIPKQVLGLVLGKWTLTFNLNI